MAITRREAMFGFAGTALTMLGSRWGHQGFALGADAPPANPPLPFETLPVNSEKVRDLVHVLSGPGGNVTVFLGKDRKIAIDSGLPKRGKDFLDAAVATDKRPVNILINTHFHFDHVGGNAVFAESGARIVAHTNTRKRVSTTQTNEFMGMTFPPAPKEAWPVVTFDTGLVMHDADESLSLTYIPAAHTDTDIAIRLHEADVLVCGDLFFNGFFPFIDYGAGGSVEGMIAAGKELATMADDSTKIVPGHGAVGGKAELAAFVQMLEQANERVNASIAAGDTEEGAVSKNLLHDLDPVWGKRMFTGNKFVTLLYRGKKKPK